MNNHPFQIRTDTAADLPAIVLEDLENGIRASVLPDHGALLNQFSLRLGDDGGKWLEAVTGYSNSADLAKNELLFYRSAKLSPFVCRIAGASYRIGDDSYEFPDKFVDGSAIHGILSDKKFVVENSSVDEKSATLVLLHEYKGDNTGYPFPYSITVKYTLYEKGRLEISSTVENRSPETIPIADGWHPYFSLGGQVDDWELQLNCGEMLELNARLVPSGVRETVTRFKTAGRIGGATFDNCYVVDVNRGNQPAAVLSHPRREVQLSFFPEPSYPFLQIYTPDDRLSIAIENLSSAPDSFNNGIGLIRLAPGEKQSFILTYRLGRLNAVTYTPNFQL